MSAIEERKISKYQYTGKSAQLDKNSAQIRTFLSHCIFWAVVPQVIIIIIRFYKNKTRFYAISGWTSYILYVFWKAPFSFGFELWRYGLLSVVGL